MRIFDLAFLVMLAYHITLIATTSQLKHKARGDIEYGPFFSDAESDFQ